MPTVKEILGFANRWYPLALETAQPVVLPSGVVIQWIAAPVFIGTKFEAFKDRGQDDAYLSHDLEDIMTVIEGRAADEGCIAKHFSALNTPAIGLRYRAHDFQL